MVDILIVAALSGLFFRKEGWGKMLCKSALVALGYAAGAFMFGFVTGIIIGATGHEIIGTDLFGISCYIMGAVIAIATVWALYSKPSNVQIAG